MIFLGLTALSLEISITFGIFREEESLQIIREEITLLNKPCIGFSSTRLTCL